jgi:LacI family transcriptional regulator
VDGAIVLGACDKDLVRRLADVKGIPVVLALYDCVETALPLAYIDSEPGGVRAARHLIERGYRDLTFLRPFTAPWVEARLAGAHEGAGPGGLRVVPDDAVRGPSTAASSQADAGRAAAEQVLGLGFRRGTGVIAPNDAVARGFMAGAAARGLAAGTDYGIVGFDDWDRATQLTSLRPPLEQLGIEAARMMIAELRGDSCPFRVALLHRLIARGSTRTWTDE